MKDRIPYLFAFASSLLFFSGCFDEPRPAYRDVDPAARVYLKGQGLTVLTPEAVYAQGRVFVVKADGDERDGVPGNGARCQGEMTNLSSRVAKFEPASLDYLNLDYNALTNVDALVSFTGLKWLRLNANRLSSLPDLKALVGLRRVYLKDNRFTAVPETLKGLPALTDIDLSGNPITEVPEWLAKKEGLENLSLSRTRITKLPADLTAWKSLKTLQLGDLQLDPAEMARIRAAFDPKSNPLGTAVVF